MDRNTTSIAYRLHATIVSAIRGTRTGSISLVMESKPFGLLLSFEHQQPPLLRNFELNPTTQPFLSSILNPEYFHYNINNERKPPSSGQPMNDQKTMGFTSTIFLSLVQNIHLYVASFNTKLLATQMPPKFRPRAN